MVNVATVGQAVEDAVTSLSHPTTTVSLHLKLVKTNLIKKDKNIQTYLPMPAGPVLSTGEKAVQRHTVRIPWSANGSTSLLLVLPPEKLANLE